MIQQLNDLATEGMVGRVSQGGNQVAAGGIGVIWQQYAAGTALANSTTETSLLSTTKVSPQLTGNAALSALATSIPIPAIPANFLSLGTQIRGKLYGTIADTGTPTLRIRVVLKNSAGTVVYTLADSTAIALVAITGTSEFEVNFDSIVSAVGTSGSLTGRVSFLYSSTLASGSAPLRIGAAPAAVTVDTTAGYSLDVLATWGAASASNTLNIAIGSIEVL